MIFLDAIGSYVAAWLLAFTREGRRLAPLGVHRLLVLLFMPLALLLLAVHWLCLALDELLFPAYRRVQVRSPVFVLGVPRSGTTFLHRELSQDMQFTTTSSWEVILAPSICQRRLVGLLAAVDRFLGAPGARLLDALLGRLSGPLDAVHEIGLTEAEEDYLALLPAAGCFFALLALPHARRLRQLGRLSEMPTAARERLLDHYHRLLQRHLFAHGDHQLLSKNAAFASWAPYLQQRYPDALLLLCIREPATALSSQLSSLDGARSAFASFRDATALRDLFIDFYAHWFAVLARCAEDDASRALVIDQAELRRRTDDVLTRIYLHLDRPRPTAARAVADSADPGRSPPPVHRHSPAERGLDPSAVARRMGADYGQLLAMARRQALLEDLRHAG